MHGSPCSYTEIEATIRLAAQRLEQLGVDRASAARLVAQRYRIHPELVATWLAPGPDSPAVTAGR